MYLNKFDGENASEIGEKVFVWHVSFFRTLFDEIGSYIDVILCPVANRISPLYYHIAGYSTTKTMES